MPSVADPLTKLLHADLLDRSRSPRGISAQHLEEALESERVHHRKDFEDCLQNFSEQWKDHLAEVVKKLGDEIRDSSSSKALRVSRPAPKVSTATRPSSSAKVIQLPPKRSCATGKASPGGGGNSPSNKDGVVAGVANEAEFTSKAEGTSSPTKSQSPSVVATPTSSTKVGATPSERVRNSILAASPTPSSHHAATEIITNASYQQQTLDKLNKSALMQERRMQKVSYRLVKHAAFDSCCALMIVGNSALIGVSTQYETQHKNPDDVLEALGMFFSAFFLLEMLLRMGAYGLIGYFTGPDAKWGMFDFVLVALSVVDLIMMLSSSSSGFAVMKTVKMLRIMRVFRIFRFFQELSLLTVLISHSIKSLVWALVLITLIIYVFAIIFTQYATQHIEDGGPNSTSVKKYFGSIWDTIYYLICSMMGGVSWVEISDVSLDMGYLTATGFFFYISFMLLAVLNIITAVFVDNAIQTAKSERDFVVQREMDSKSAYVTELIRVFQELDADHSGDISWDELQNFFSDERVQVYFEALGLSVIDLERLWELLDEDSSGSVGLTEFLEGCVRFKGWARSIDMHFQTQRLKKIEQDLQKLAMFLGRRVTE